MHRCQLRGKNVSTDGWFFKFCSPTFKQHFTLILYKELFFYHMFYSMIGVDKLKLFVIADDWCRDVVVSASGVHEFSRENHRNVANGIIRARRKMIYEKIGSKKLRYTVLLQ